MSKKKNVRRKKSNNLLKGVAAAGAVVGGGTIFAGNNAVYAAENEQDAILAKEKQEELLEKQSVSESTTESLSNSTSDHGVFNLGESIFKSAAEPDVAMVADTGENTSEATIIGNQGDNEGLVEDEDSNVAGDTATAEENTTTPTEQDGNYNDENLQDESKVNTENEENGNTESTSEELSESTSAMYSEAAKQESLNVAVSNSLSLSNAGKYDSNGNPLLGSGSDFYRDSLSNAMNEYDEKYNSISKDYENKINSVKAENTFLRDIFGEIEKQKAKVDEAYSNWKNSSWISSGYYKNDFYTSVDALVELYAKYFLYQIENNEPDIDKNTSWVKNDKDNNFVKVDYSANGKNQSAYFDYVITDDKDVRIDKQDDWQKQHNTISIMVLKKSPIYQNGNSQFYFYDDFSLVDEKVHRETTFYIDGVKYTNDKNQNRYVESYTYLGNDKYKVVYIKDGKKFEKEFKQKYNGTTTATTKDGKKITVDKPVFANITNNQSPGYNGVKGQKFFSTNAFKDKLSDFQSINLQSCG